MPDHRAHCHHNEAVSTPVRPEVILPPGPTIPLPPAVVELLVVAIFVVIPTVAMVAAPDGPSVGAAIVGAALSLPLVVLRRRWPLPLLGTAVVLLVVVSIVTGAPSPLLAAVVLLLYTMAAETDRRRAWTIGAAVMVVQFVTGAIFLDERLAPIAIPALPWSALALATGDAVRSRRAYIAEVAESMRRAAEAHDEEARRRLAEERLRIARELHDVVAHRMAVIGVQAAAARQLVRADPKGAEASLEVVRESAATVLDELGGLLHVLRTDDEGAPTTPGATLEELDELVGSFNRAGLRVTRRDTGVRRPLPEFVSLAAYRVIQEGLTNAAKHGDGTAALHIGYAPTALEVTVENDLAPDHQPAATGTGLGLVGIRERIAAVGGDVSAGPNGEGGFSIHARLPIPAEPRP